MCHHPSRLKSRRRMSIAAAAVGEKMSSGRGGREAIDNQMPDCL